MRTRWVFRFLEVGSFLGIFLGCASTSVKQDSHPAPTNVQPPAYDFLIQNRDHSLKDLEGLKLSSENLEWWRKYRQGLLSMDKDPVFACAQFGFLAHEEHFPLKDIALLRAHQTCDKAESLPPLNPELYRTTYKWSQDVLADVLLKEARKTPDKKDDLTALKEKARLETLPKKKEQYLLEALKIASDLKLQPEIEEVQDLLYKTSPRLNPKPAAKDLPAVALDHRQQREFDAALKIYKEIVADPQATTDEKFQALKNTRMTYKVAQEKNSYIDATTQLVNFAKADFRAHKKDKAAIQHLNDSYILLTRTLWTEDQNSLALQFLNEAKRELQGRHSLDEIYFLLGRMSEEKADLAKASSYYQASLQEPVASSNIHEKVLWLYPWVLYKMQNYELAATKLGEFAQKAKDPSDKARAEFWQARCLKNLNKTAEATELLKKLMQEDPVGYYGVLAVRELNQTYPALKSDDKVFAYSLENLKELPTQTALQAEWVMAIGENTFAEKILDSLASDIHKHAKPEDEELLILLTSYARADLYLPLFSAIGALPQTTKDDLVLKHPELLFPRNYKDLILPAAQTEQVPSELIFSIIRQESAFNPRARSPVDAFGLMQLLPSVAKELSRGTSVPYKEAEDLYEPEINVPLGAKEIRRLLAKYDNQYILSVASYNANDSAIRGWLKTRYRKDALEFIEEVPYEETRSYIKLLLRNYVFYKRLNQSGGSIVFPEEWLKLVSK